MFRLIFCLNTLVLVLAKDDQLNESLFLLGSTSNKFTAEFLYNGVTKFPGSNFVTSIFPLQVAAGQLMRFSKAMTKRKLSTITTLRNEEQIPIVYPEVTKLYFNESLTSKPKLSLKVYTDDDNEFCPKFVRSYKQIFNGETGTVDYSDPEEAAREINDYVKEQGRGAFKDLVSSKKIEDKNGYNFISTFDLQYKFDERFVFTESREIQFKSRGKVVNKPGAFGEGIVKYAYVKSIDAQTVEILSEGADFSYFIVYPKKPDGLMNVLNKFRDPRFFQHVISQGSEVCARAVVIDTEVTKTVNLGASLQQIPMYKDLFEPGKPKFHGISESCDNGYIASILHEVNLTPAELNCTKRSTCKKYEVEFETNHPHVYYLLTAKSEANMQQVAVAGFVVQS